MIDEFSNFKSAIVWPDNREPEEAPTGELKPFSTVLLQAIEIAAESFTMAGVTESPIETIFGAKFGQALRSLCKDLGREFSVGTEEEADLVLHPQYPLECFRYDFAVRSKTQMKPLLLIECDGKDFHSSPKQLANDKLKDLAASNAGIRLIRFSESEINRDVDRSAEFALAAYISAAFQ
jgi:very-short-patch-repair endonuclease